MVGAGEGTFALHCHHSRHLHHRKNAWRGGAWPQQHGQTANTGDRRSIVFSHPIRHHACRRSWTNRKHRSGFTVIARGYVDDRAKPERLRFPRLPRKKGRGKRGNARLRPHTHRQTPQQGRIYILILKKEAGGAGGRLLFSQSGPAGEQAVARAVPDQKAGPVFFAQEIDRGRGQKIFRSRGPARAFDRVRRRAAFVGRRVGTEGCAFSDRT